MKFINYLENITGVGIFPLISLLIFFLFFLTVCFYLFSLSKQHIEEVGRLPLNDNDGPA